MDIATNRPLGSPFARGELLKKLISLLKNATSQSTSYSSSDNSTSSNASSALLVDYST